MKRYRVRRTDTNEFFAGYNYNGDPVWAKEGTWFSVRGEAAQAIAELLHHRTFCTKFTPKDIEALDLLYPDDVKIIEYNISETPPDVSPPVR